MFDVRIVNVDHYMATPFRGLDPVYSDFRGTSVSQVPIIRIFGSTESGKKTCLHIHGVLPYIYVPFDGESDPNQQMYQLAASLDKALNIALGTANSARQHIYKVVHVKGVPFYGYHEKSHQFLKIYFYNPLIVKKATDLLQNGAVCNKIFQCHEAHLPFILQFFIDYNLHGMSFIQLSSVDIRKEPGSMHSNLECDVRLAKTTYCELEVDGLASDILNRKTVSEGEVANPGLAGIWSEERLRNEADASQLSEKQSQQRTANNKTLSEVLLRQRLREALNELSGKISGGSVSTVLYPIESTPGDDIHDASMVACNICTDHESSTCVPKLDDSVIDEQLVLSLSQAPVNIQDLSLLDMMQGLAERGAESYENEGAGEGDEWVSAKSGSALLSQSFHCSNMEADSVLGMMQPAVDSLADHTTQKEDCWQDSVWNGMDLDDIPQLDGAPDECDEEGDVPSSRRQTRQSLKSNADMMRKESPMSKTAVRVSSPISINSSEDDSYMSCTPMNIFNQERFWCSKKENADSDLEESLFDDRMTPVTFLKPDVFDDGINSCENTASTYDNVLMHGDPSLNSLAEAVTEVNDIELNDNKKSELTETGLETLEENSLDSDISSDFCLQLKEDSDGVVTSPEFIFNLDYDYSSIDNNEGCGENNEAVNKKKPKKDNKGAGNSTNDHGTSKNNKPSSSKREKNPPNNSNKVENVVCNEKQIIDIELEQENIELNNNRKKKHCKNENINEEGASDCDGVTATEHRKSKMSCKTNKKSSKSSEKSQVTHVISESPSKKQKKNRISGEIVNGEGLKSKNSLKETAHNIDKNSESPSKNQKKASSDVEPMNKKNSSVNKNVGNNGTKTVKDYSVEEEDDDDDDDLFRINFNIKKEVRSRGNTTNKSPFKSKPKTPIKAATPVKSTELQEQNCQNDSNQSFPCYFFKSNGVAMKFNFPLKHKLSEKTKQLLVERRKGFANVLSPMVDFRIKVSNLEDGYLTREIVEEYYEKQNSSEDQLNLCEVNAVDNSSPTPKKMKIFDNSKPKNNTASANLSPEPGVKTSVKQVNPKKILSPKIECGRNRKDSVSSPKRSKIRKSLDFELRSEVNDSGDSLSKTVEQNYLSSTGKNKSKSISLQKPPEHFKGFDEFELNENDFNKPNKMHFPNTPTNLQASGSSLPKRNKSFNAAKNTILKPSLKVMCDVESSNKTEKQSPNIPILKSVVKGSPIKNSNSLNRDGKIDENFNSPKSKISSRLEKCLRLNNIKPCKVVIVRLPENDNHLSVKTRSSRQKQKKKAPFPKPKQHNVVVNDRKLVDCSMPIENSWQVNQGVAVCSEKEFDTFQVPFDRFEVAETSSKIDVEDSHNLSKLVEENPIEFRLSVRLDRIDQSVFFRSNDKRDSFKIDNLDGSFGEDMETSSDDDVPITPSARKTDRNKACLSTPRPRYKPLKVKITKSPPRKVSKPLPQCWVLLNKLNFDDYKGSCSGSAASSSHCLAGYSKIRNPVDATSSHSHSHSGSDYCAIFGEGEVLSQPEPKKAVNLQLEPDEDDFEYLASSNLSQAAQDKTCQKVETNSEAIGLCSESIDEENINDQSFLNASENYDDSEKSSFPYRNALPVDPVTLKSKDTVDKYMSIPGPSTSSTQPWYNANVYGSDSSTDEKEDKGILSFYNTSVYFPENDSDSEKTIYEIVSLGDDSCEVSGEEYKTFIPKIEPPSHDGILSSLSQYGLTNVLNPEPFCSDLSDRASTEVGPVSLKLKSRTAIDLEEYDGPYSKGLCMYRNNLLKSLQVKGSSVLAGDREVSLIPLKRPPSCMQVKKWLKVKTQLKETKKSETEDKSEKVERLIVACSPGQDYGSDEEQNTLVLTPMSPPSRIHSTPSDCPPGASLFLTDTPLCTPVPLAPGRRTKRKSSDILKKSSAKLLKNDAAMSSMSQENEADAAHAQKEELELQLSDSSICISEETRNNMEAELKKKARLSCSFQIEACNNSDSTSSGLPTRIDNLQKTRPQIQHQYLTLMFLELHVQTRGDLLPDPENDAIRAVFYHFVNDVPEQADNITMLTGIIAVGHLVAEDETVSVTCVSDEMALLVALVQLIRKWDPDMFIGYEIEKLSWGYLIERAYTVGMNLNVELSRVMGAEGAARHEDEQGMLAEDIRLAGRIVLNVWRLMRHEVALQSYTFENMMYHVLRRRIPLFSFRSLSAWWEHRTQLYRWMTVEHYLVRVRGVAEIVDHLDLIGRTSELARLFGIQFYEVLSRGSQFRVESMMLRMAKPENYVAVSPTTKQRAHMRAPESLPLIMEPESRFYADPVIVLDFQSLYPSIIIAYNYCFSTCLGRVENLAKSEFFNFGCTHLRVPFSTVNKLEENLNYSPCGVAFVNSSIRRGVLPRMLQEILETRLMVKRSMKKNKNNKALHKVLHNRQLGLKLIANVTYGYTSANFSGRMPCIEIGDSVVSKGRETLERAIALVNKTEKWGARVVYGDTDSLFVLVPGRSRADAFRIGAEIAEAVTAENPKPVKLKLEKVYQPCILQTKKRYVGHMWESPDQETPTYDAKGIETVRRDGCPAVAKILQKSLQLLFETKDVSIVKRFTLHQFGKVSSGRISIQELTFAREYRGARGYKPGACVPALELARSWLKKDRRSEPPVGERVPYVVVAGPPGLPLIRLVRSPRALLADPALKINAEYYITRVIIPPLNRCLLLVSADALNWFKSMPRRQAPSLPSAVPSGVKKATISQYFATVTCAVCHEHNCTTGICDYCQARPQTVAVSLATQLNAWERRRHLVIKACQSCCRRSTNIDCISLDCPVLYARADADRQLTHEPVFRKLQHEYFDCDF